MRTAEPMPTSTQPLVITHYAGRAGDHNDRAMQGSVILTAELAARLGATPVVIGSAQPPLNDTWGTELTAARPTLEAMATHVESVFRSGAFPLIALSRCAVALATLPVVAKHRPDAVVVWLDAHADLNTPENSSTGYLGGLALSGPLGMWDSGLGAGLSPENAILCGVRDIDPAEQALIDQGRVALVAPGADLSARLREVVAGRPVYVHIDCDVIEPGIVPTDYWVPGGLTLADLAQAAAVLAESEVVGVEIGEFEAGERATAHPGPLLDALRPLFPTTVAVNPTPSAVEVPQ